MRWRVLGWILSNSAAAALSMRGSNDRIMTCCSSIATKRPMLTSLRIPLKSKPPPRAGSGHGPLAVRPGSPLSRTPTSSIREHCQCLQAPCDALEPRHPVGEGRLLFSCSPSAAVPRAATLVQCSGGRPFLSNFRDATAFSGCLRYFVGPLLFKFQQVTGSGCSALTETANAPPGAAQQRGWYRVKEGVKRKGQRGRLGVFAPRAKQTPNRPQRNRQIKSTPGLARARKPNTVSFWYLASTT